MGSFMVIIYGWPLILCFFFCSIKKKVKGGQGGGAVPNPNCKTLPSNCNSPGGAPVPHPHHSLKFNKGGGLVEHPSSGLGAPGEPISSAIVKYNYQAQQLDELSLVKGARILILEKSGDVWWRGQCGNKVNNFCCQPQV